jgi:signal transduction histidine kinase
VLLDDSTINQVGSSWAFGELAVWALRPRTIWLGTGLLAGVYLVLATPDRSELFGIVVLPIGLPLLLGLVLRTTRELADQAERRVEAEARVARADERGMIARELHDVVAHSMSVIAVQAGVANHVIDSRPELARQALATVETNTRAALVEMRRLLGVLRQGDEPSASLAPAPGLTDVPALVKQFGQAGLAVQVRVDGVPDGVPDGVDLSAYRIIQEGLTNVLRHGGPTAQVAIDYRGAAVAIEISDPGPGARARSGENGPGHGLIGMRERVAVFGGRFTAGPQPGGGFRLTATLPFADTARSGASGPAPAAAGAP